MIHPTALMIAALQDRLAASWQQGWGGDDPEVAEIAGWAAGVVLGKISQSDALYHDVEHTLMVTQVGLELLRGRHLGGESVDAEDWLHAVLALLCHDVGYVRGACADDRPGAWITGDGTTIDLPQGATDASLQPWHVERGKRFARERFRAHPRIDVDRVVAMIDYTQYPVPADPAYGETRSIRALVRAADLLGQLSDPHYLQKLPALYAEFRENGMDRTLGITHHGELRADYPSFYERTVRPWVEDALDWLRATPDGRGWIASLLEQVHRAEHEPTPRDG